MNRKAIELSFQMIVTLLIIGVILFVSFFGFKTIFGYVKGLKYADLKKTIDTAYSKALELGYGSEYPLVINGYNNFYLCFYDENAQQDQIDFPVNIDEEILKSSDKNVYLISPTNKTTPLTTINVKLKKKGQCLKSNGNFKLTFISRGDYVEIKELR